MRATSVHTSDQAGANQSMLKCFNRRLVTQKTLLSASILCICLFVVAMSHLSEPQAMLTMPNQGATHAALTTNTPSPDQGATHAASTTVITNSYYVDCVSGDDTHTGTAATQAWKNLARANAATLRPGDRLLLKRDCVWTGPLNVSWSGTASQPITIAAYGTGSAPVIKNAARNVSITGSYTIIDGLEVTDDWTTVSFAQGCKNPDASPQAYADRVGFYYESTSSYNILRNSKASRLSTGVLLASNVNLASFAGAHHNRITGNQIVNNNLMKTLDRANANNDDGAFGMLIEGDDNEVDHNTISGSNACSYDYGRDGASVEIFAGRYNAIHHNRGVDSNTFTELGHARSSDNTYVYNRFTSSLPRASFVTTRGANDFFGPVYRTKLYHNTVYLTGNASYGLICYGGCSPSILTAKNNIFWSDGTAGYADRPFDEGYNLYWKTGGAPGIAGYTPAATSIRSDPHFVDLATLDLHLRSSSPAIDRGSAEALDAGYSVDLAGTVVPQGSAPDMGAYEFETSSATPTPSLATPRPAAAATTTPAPPPVTPTPAAAASATPASALLTSAVSTSDQTNTSALVSWTSSLPGTSRVAYGTTSADLRFSTVEDQPLTTAHSVALTDLLANTRYYYRVYSKDAAGVEYTSALHSFQTK